ncbi:cupin domain-containing protein [Agrobacterium pusense]|uniref:cupin domain-containing protein n=1 Tax=Agrobacterium pusense TaxID=648995 RepID=UPI003FD68734
MMAEEPTSKSARFDLRAIAAAFPETSDTLLVDRYLRDTPAASSRIFRVYEGTPPHFHRGSDEYLYVLSGRGTFWMEDQSNEQEFGPGQLLFFEKGTVHALPKILQHPVIFLSVDTPRREPADIVFVNDNDGTPQTFISQQKD